jgi:hypothetical protein
MVVDVLARLQEQKADARTGLKGLAKLLKIIG